MSAYRYKRPSVPNEVRIIGRLTSDPEPEGAGVLLRLRVTYGISRVERMVLATGGGAAAARELHAGDLVYVVGHRAGKDSEHEVEAGHVLELQPTGHEEDPARLPF